jgi:hypothetical protein
MSSGVLHNDLTVKFRDSFLYQWASKKLDKPLIYLVLLAMDSLTPAELLTLTESLGRNIPIIGPSSWKRPMAKSCLVLNLAQWQRSFPDFMITRMSKKG